MIAARLLYLLLTMFIVVNSHGAARADALAGHDCFANDAMLRIRGCTELLQRDHLDPVTRSTALATRALGLSIIGRYNEAIRDYDKALKIIPNYPVALNNRAWALVQAGPCRRSGARCRKVAAARPDEPPRI